MFMCCTKWSLVINLIYSGQELFSHTWMEVTEIDPYDTEWITTIKSLIIQAPGSIPNRDEIITEKAITAAQVKYFSAIPYSLSSWFKHKV